MCVAIVRANPRSVAFCEVVGSKFKRIFVASVANVNGFKLGCVNFVKFRNLIILIILLNFLAFYLQFWT